MGLVDQLTRLFRRQEVDPGPTTSDELEPRPAAYSPIGQRFQAESGRRALVKLAREMYAEDPRVDAAVVATARDATKGGFQVSVEGPNASRAQEVADTLFKRLKLERAVDDWFRLTLRDGDGFLELSVNGVREIVQITRKPTLDMHRHTDKADRWIDPERAFWMDQELYSFAGEPGPNAIWFPAWAIVHARWRYDGDTRYGKPLFSPASSAYKRVREGESDVAVRRKTRAPMRYVHELIDADESTIRKYIERNKSALEGESAIADFFTNVKGGISSIQGDARLAEIADVEHHIETLGMASPVPLALLGYGKNLNRDILEQKLEQYERALESISDWVVDQLVEPLLTRQWLLQGIWPQGIDYEIRRGYMKPLVPADVVAVADALMKLKSTQLFQPDMLIDLGATMLPHIDAELAKAELAAAMTAQPDEIDRIGRILAGQQQNQDQDQDQEDGG